VYERIVAERPTDARALVILANAYWLAGRGPEVVGDLASRAIAADPTNRGGWHLWALTESNPRRRTDRWLQVSRRFPGDDLAKANLATTPRASPAPRTIRWRSSSRSRPTSSCTPRAPPPAARGARRRAAHAQGLEGVNEGAGDGTGEARRRLSPSRPRRRLALAYFDATGFAGRATVRGLPSLT
jgi:hypothetical protein